MDNQLGSNILFTVLSNVREQSPLIHNVTNLVVMQTTANVLLALGASPIMAHAQQELEQLVSIANALVLNIGTLDDDWIAAMDSAQKLALARPIPIVLDPVGAGASSLRTQTSIALLEQGVNIIRGNASEIVALADSNQKTKGVDSLLNSRESLIAAKHLSQQYNCCVVTSGEQDIICYAGKTLILEHGHPILTKVTGMGCSATAMIAAFASIEKDPMLASAYAMTTLGIAAEKAAINTHGPGSFYSTLLDTLYQLNQNDFRKLNYSFE